MSLGVMLILRVQTGSGWMGNERKCLETGSRHIDYQAVVLLARLSCIHCCRF